MRKVVSLHVCIHPDLKQALDQIAKASHQSLSSVVEALLIDELHNINTKSKEKEGKENEC